MREGKYAGKTIKQIFKYQLNIPWIYSGWGMESASVMAWRVLYLINKYSRDIEYIPWQVLDGGWPVPANCMPSLATGWLEFANNLTGFARGCHCIAKTGPFPASC